MSEKVKLRYVGPHLEVELSGPDGSWHVVAHGDEKEFPAEVAESLLEQAENWRLAEQKVSPAAAKLAEDEGVNVNDAVGSGADGAVTVDDVRELIAERDAGDESDDEESD